MADQKFSVEDILSEYGESEGKGYGSSKASGRLETQQLLRHTAPGSKPLTQQSRQPGTFRRAEEESKINRIKQETRSGGRADIESSRAAAFHTLEIMREKVSFMNSAAADPQTAPKQKNERIAGYEGAVRLEPESRENKAGVKESYQPSIRVMEDSTRAREEKKTSLRRKKDLENRHSYRRDTFTGDEQAEVETVKPEDESKPFFFDLQHANAVKFISREVREERERRRRVAAIRRLRKKRMKMREPEDENGKQTVHLPNNDSEIRANINILRKTVIFRAGALMLLFLASALLCVLGGSKESALSCVVQLILGMCAIGIAFPTVANGIRYLCINRADSDSMAAAPIAASVLSAMISLMLPGSLERGEAHIFVPAALFILFMNAVGKLIIIKRAVKNFSVISGKYEQYVLSYVSHEGDAENLTRGVQHDYPILVSMRKARRMSDFLRYTYSEDIGDRFCRKVTPFVVIGSFFIAALITGIRFTVMPSGAIPGFFFSVFAMLLCGGCCSGVMLAANIPLGLMAKKLSKRGCALLGYQSVDDFYDTNTILVSASQLFNEGNVTIDGMKAFRDARIEDVVLISAAMSRQADSVLWHAFGKMLDEESQLPFVDSVVYEEGFGLSGWVKNRRVLLGNREMMEAHSIEGLPSPMREAEYAGDGSEVLYYSVSGIVSAMMLVRLNSSQRMKEKVHRLLDENIALVVKSCDSFLTQQRIAGLYQISESDIKVIPIALHDTFNKYTETAEFVSASVITSGKADDTVRLLLGARRIRRSATTGIILQAVTMIIGFAIALIYIGLSAYTSVSAEMFLILQIFSAIITAIAVRLK